MSSSSTCERPGSGDIGFATNSSGNLGVGEAGYGGFGSEGGGVSPVEMDRKLRRVFAALDRTGRGRLSREEFEFLDHWTCRRFGVPLRGIPEKYDFLFDEQWSPPARFGSTGGFGNSTSSSFRTGPTTAIAEASTAPGLEAFKVHLESRAGSCGRAWRTFLDLRGHGELTAGEFGKGCRAIGWKHPHMTLWRELHEAGGGRVTLRALDPETAQSVDDINTEILASCGDVASFWDEVLDPDHIGALGRADFVQIIVGAFNMNPSAVRRVFDVLDTGNTGWLDACEVQYLEVLERARMAESSSAPVSATSWRSGPEKPLPLWDPSRRTRNIQNLSLAQSYSIKHRWLCQSGVKLKRHAYNAAKEAYASQRTRDEDKSRGDDQQGEDDDMLSGSPLSGLSSRSK